MKRYMLLLEKGLTIYFDTQKSAKDFLYKDLYFFYGYHTFTLWDTYTFKVQKINYYSPIGCYYDGEFDNIKLSDYIECQFGKWE